MANKQTIDDILTRGVGEFIDPEGIFRKKLEVNPEKIVIKFGIDPTRPDIHIGHAIVLRKLRQFQDLGCKIIFLVGDFTVLIGDPTGKSKIRPEISQKEIGLNMATYAKQIPTILKIEPISEKDKKEEIIKDSNGFITDSPWFGWMRNSDWFFNVTDIDPTGVSDNLREFKDKGQSLVFSEGNFLDKATVFRNSRMQALIKKTKIETVSLVNFLSVLRRISHSQLIERDMFQVRIKKKEPLFMHEMLYPVAQGIDSDVIFKIYGSCDLEVGGTDQTFNMLMGRKVMEMTGKKKNEIQAVLAFKLLEGIDGKEKMSKSLDNYIGITDEPSDMYGKVMSIPDSSILNYFELCTITPMEEIETIRKQLKDESVNPKDVKMNLARQIVEIYHGREKAAQAENSFISAFQKGEIPTEMEEIKGSGNLGDILVSGKVLVSKSEWHRLVDEGAVKRMSEKGEEKISDFKISAAPGVYKIGKKRFIKIV